MIRLWLINPTRGYDLTSEPQKLEELSWLIVARFIHIMCAIYLREKANFLEAAIFTWYFSITKNRGCLFYIYSLRFLGSKFLINLRRQFRVGKTFVYVEIFGYKFSGIYRLHFIFKVTISKKFIIYALGCSFAKTSYVKWFND